MNTGNKHYMSVFQHSPIFYPSDWSSLYIHTLPAGYHTPLQLTELLETRLCIGKVKRIDLVHKKHKDGEIQYDGFSAFIHFTHWFQNANVDYLRNSISEHGICDVSGVIISQIAGIGFVDAFGKPVYVRFSKNTKPIPEIAFNTQQISEKLTVAENTIIQQQLRLLTLEYQMSRVMDQLATIVAAAAATTSASASAAATAATTSASASAAATAATGPPGFESDDEDYSQPLTRIEELKAENTFCNNTTYSKWIELKNNEAIDDSHWTDSLPTDRKWTMDEVRHALYLNCEPSPVPDDMVTVEKKETEPNRHNERDKSLLEKSEVFSLSEKIREGGLY